MASTNNERDNMKHNDGSTELVVSGMANSSEPLSTPDASKAISTFSVTPERMLDLLDPKNPELYLEWGKAAGLAKSLQTDLKNGLAKDSSLHQDRLDFYGTNSLPEPASKNIFQFMWDALQDKTLIVLCVAAFVEMAIGIYKFRFAPIGKRDNLGLIDGAAIVVAVLIVVLVGSISDYRKQNQFRQLSDFSKSLSETKVVRDGETIFVPTEDILVGDIVMIETGDIVVADGVLVEGFQVKTDESTLTGEPNSVNKDLARDPFLLSGTKVVNGVGRMIVVATGINSLNGRSLLALEVEPEATPLQEKLGRIADMIAKFGVIAAFGMTVVLLISYFVASPPAGKDSFQISQDIVALLILAITIVVVAVPEGLPLAVTISLAHATLCMLKDNNLVRHLAACETMGNATTICSDKTGTLTMNRMTVVEGVMLQVDFKHADIPETLKKSIFSNVTVGAVEKLLGFIAMSLNVNSTASESKDKEGILCFNGSKTEVALLEFTRLLGFEYQKDRDTAKLVAIQPFSSDRKRMSCVMRIPVNSDLENQLGLAPNEMSSSDATTKDWVCIKGASEIVLGLCDRYVDANGKVQPLTEQDRAHYTELISSYASNALRTIGAAIRPLQIDDRTTANGKSDLIPSGDQAEEQEQSIPDDSNLILIGIFGIQDPLRPEVPAAVASCQSAGIVVRMVTGDNIQTARAIARGCGILTADGLSMEGPKFRMLTEAEMNDVLPRLQVLARSSPLDKQILVNNLKRLGETVAVTGDGTNDAPALAAADVGFSMGIAGTEVAKEASDIVLMDDNFASLVKAVIWGRCVYDSIRKFLQFQLTVNVSAVLLTIITSFYTTVSGPKTVVSVLSAVQLLWINLIMDTFAALALATDPPSPDLLNRKPSNRSESIISPDMFKMIVGQGVYQIAVCLVLFFCGPKWWGTHTGSIDEIEAIKETGVDITTASIIFNSYVFCQVFNEINCRSITSAEKNIFRGFFANKMFLGILALTIFLQAIIIQFVGVIFKTSPNGLTGVGWGISLLVGSGSLIVGFLVRCLPDFPLPKFLYPTQPKKTGRGVDGSIVDTPVTVTVTKPSLDGFRPDGTAGAIMPASDKDSYTEKLIVTGADIPVKIHGEEKEEFGALAIGDSDHLNSVTERNNSRQLWNSAIKKTRIQLRVVGHFTAPAGSRVRAMSSGKYHFTSTAPPELSSTFGSLHLPATSATPSGVSMRSPPLDSTFNTASAFLSPGMGGSKIDSTTADSAGADGKQGSYFLDKHTAEHSATQSASTAPTSSSSQWLTVRDLVRTVSVVNAFRTGRSKRIDFTTLQVVDVNSIRRTRAIHARQMIASRASHLPPNSRAPAVKSSIDAGSNSGSVSGSNRLA
ncbi:plasma membrane calcium [Batrachochytrium dendrobatidis]|nr:plasma membrane calcium [Batrachochytrium dendrobatidis]KAK5665602.1 plasma membrane calcium [Batrachochytrium dendrobatidis]